MSEMVGMPIVKIGNLVLDNVVAYSYGRPHPPRGVGSVFLVGPPPDILIKLVLEGKQPKELMRYYIISGRLTDEVIFDIKGFGKIVFGMVIVERIETNYDYNVEKCIILMRALRMRFVYTKEELARMKIMSDINKGEIYFGFKPEHISV